MFCSDMFRPLHATIFRQFVTKITMKIQRYTTNYIFNQTKNGADDFVYGAQYMLKLHYNIKR